MVNKDDDMSNTFIAEVGQKSAIANDDVETLSDEVEVVPVSTEDNLVKPESEVSPFPEVKIDPPKENEVMKMEDIPNVTQKDEVIPGYDMEPNDNEEKPKKKKGHPVLIVFLMIFCLAFGSAATYYYFEILNGDNKETTTVPKEEKIETIENLEVTDSQVVKLYDTVTQANNQYCGIDDYYTDKKVTANDISNEKVFDIAVTQLAADLKATGKNPFAKAGDGFTVQELENKITSIFGKQYKFTHKDSEGCPSFKYDEANKQYTMPADSACGGTCGPSNLKKVVKALKTDKTMEIYVRVIFVGDDDGNKVSYYKDSTKTELLSDLEVDSNGFALDSDSNIAKGSLYKMIFTNEDDNYVFTSSELVK